jgi:pyruvate dehydrogenase E1 component alpha subunit
MIAELFGREGGCSRGRGGSMHMQDPETGNIGTTGIVASGIPVAAGVALGIRQEQSDRVVVCFFGDGAANNGVFLETLNLAAVYSLPLVLVLEDNCWAAATPSAEVTGCRSRVDLVRGFGIPAVRVSGNDPVLVYRAALNAVENARQGDGPAFIEASTYRRLGHHINDAGDYMPADELAYWEDRDPLSLAREYLVEAYVPPEEVEAIDRAVDAEIEEAVAFAAASPRPDVREFLEDIARYDV